MLQRAYQDWVLNPKMVPLDPEIRKKMKKSRYFACFRAFRASRFDMFSLISPCDRAAFEARNRVLDH